MIVRDRRPIGAAWYQQPAPITSIYTVSATGTPQVTNITLNAEQLAAQERDRKEREAALAAKAAADAAAARSSEEAAARARAEQAAAEVKRQAEEKARWEAAKKAEEAADLAAKIQAAAKSQEEPGLVAARNKFIAEQRAEAAKAAAAEKAAAEKAAADAAAEKAEKAEAARKERAELLAQVKAMTSGGGSGGGGGGGAAGGIGPTPRGFDMGPEQAVTVPPSSSPSSIAPSFAQMMTPKTLAIAGGLLFGALLLKRARAHA